VVDALKRSGTMALSFGEDLGGYSS
jgi:hypothetical protein